MRLYEGSYALGVFLTMATESGGKLPSVPVHWLAYVVLPAFACHQQLIRSVFVRVVLDDRLSHIVALPVVGMILLWLDADTPYRIEFRGRIWCGLVSAVAALAGVWAGVWFVDEGGTIVQFFLLFAALCFGFVWLYGWETFARRRFAFFVLALGAPPPDAALRWFETCLQVQSANTAELFFRLIGISYLRLDTVFSLPGIVIEVARECSGVRSALAILAAVVVGSRLALRGTAGRVVLCVSAIPIAIVKNAVRITVLAAGGVWVSPDILRGPLHKYGGPVFSVVAVVLFAVVIIGLRWFERRQQDVSTMAAEHLGGESLSRGPDFETRDSE